MKRALVFGGLSPFGFFLSQELLEREWYVTSVSSAQTPHEKEIEDGRELCLGRNALFQVGKEEPEAAVYTCYFFVDTVRSDVGECRRNKDKLKKILVPGIKPAKQSVILLSSVDAFEKDVPPSSKDASPYPLTAEGRAARDMELFFVNELQCARLARSLIFRTQLNLLEGPKRVKRAAGLMADLAGTDFSGLNIVSLSDGLESDEPDYQRIRRMIGQKIKRGENQ